MKSICIKMRRSNDLDCFIKEYQTNYIDKTKIKIKKFKVYYNFIVHYLSDEDSKFCYEMAIILCNYIIDNYEKRLIKRCINKNYFYFDEFEKQIIFKISLKILDVQELDFNYRTDILVNIIFNYIIQNKNFYLEGFINFRLMEYIEILDYLIEISVMNYLKFI